MTVGSIRTTGSVALVAAIWLAIGNVTHPIGNTDLYTDGLAFVEHTNTYWIVNHWLLAIALLVTPWLVAAWTDSFDNDRAKAWGRLALYASIMGTGLGVLHLAGVDGSAFPAYGRILESNTSDITVAIADGLQVVHLATYTAWSTVFWGVLQIALGVAMLSQRARPGWLGGLLVACGVLGLGTAFVSAAQGHLSTFSEGVLLRGSTVGLTIWLFWLAWVMRSKGRVELVESSA